MNNHNYILFIFLSLVFSFTSFSQEPIYNHYGVDDGLPSSEVYDIYQDKEGYIWFATVKGLSRYNGYEFENFNSNNGLPGNVVLRFYPQSNGQVWCYTHHNKALFYFNEKFNGFTPYEHNKLLSSKLHGVSSIKSVFLDSLNSLHIGGFEINGEIIISENGDFNTKHNTKDYFGSIQEIVLSNELIHKSSNFHYTRSTTSAVRSNFSKVIHKNAHIQGEWMMTHEKAVFMSDKEVQIVDDDNVILIKSQQTSLRVKTIDSTHFFVGYHFGGAKIINTKGKVQKEFLNNKSVTNFLIDHEGGYWFTTLNSGVFYIKAPSVLVLQDSLTNTNLHISSLAKNAKNELLIGYENGSFAKKSKDNNYTINLSKIKEPAFVEYDKINNKGYLFSERSIKDFNNKILIKNSYITNLSELTFNKSIFATSIGGYYDVIEGKLKKFPYRIEDICVLNQDTLLATPHGVLKKTKDSFIALSNKSELLGYRSDDIDILNLKGDYVVATQGAGVVVYTNKRVYAISETEGLTSNVVNEVHVENDSTIWACTNKGLNKITLSPNNYTVATIDKNNGLLSNEVEDIEIINDTLWIGTKLGLCYMPKEMLDQKQQDNSYFKLKEIAVNDIGYGIGKELKLKYKENKITFLVEGISFSHNSDLAYQYRLKEAGSSWNTTKNRSISFPNLSPGKYTFQAKVCLGDTDCSKNLLEYQFLIRPPFWKTGWFYTLCILVFLGLMYVFFKIRVLTYNKDVVRELIRVLIKRLKGKEKFISIRTNGEDVKIATHEILYVKSSDNYVDIITTNKTYTMRHKIGAFIELCPDPLEYLRIHRTYIIRIDQVTSKGRNWIVINQEKLPVGKTYLAQLDKLQF